MEYPTNLFKKLLLSLLCSASIVVADDTEIYFDLTQVADPDAYKPNVLFILDTSGSMTGNVTTIALPPAAYDPNTDYGSSPDTNIYGYATDFSLFTPVIKTEVSCQAMLNHLTNTPSDPVYTGRTAGYENSDSSWNAFGWWPDFGDVLECEDDEGIHGQTDATNPYTAVVPGSFRTSSRGNYYGNVPSGGPYSSNASATIDWGQMQTRTFVTANYHDYIQSGSTISTDSKTNVMKAAAIDLVNNFTGLNLGLMRFDGNNGGYVVHHFSDIETDGSNIITAINSLGASGNTPLTETLWEAHRYYAGLSVDYGINSNRDSAAISAGNYVSPIDSDPDATDCQANYVVLLTDGQPTRDGGRDTQISALGQGTCNHTGGTTANSSCLDEMSAYMSTYDYNSGLNGDQSLKVYTIGFDTTLELLTATATDGEDGTYTANNSSELRDAFQQIVNEILQSSTTFVAPSVSVNAFNSLQNRNEVYYALFEPNKFPRWYGNVKKYKINSKGAILGVGMADDTDKDSDVIGDTTGYFLDDAESYWGGRDGSNVKLGGAASQLTNARSVYTVAGNASAVNISLNTPENTITADLSSTDISNTLYGINDAAYPNQAAIDAARQELINWILGVDVEDDDGDSDSTDASNFMSDSLHSRPVVVTYGGTQSDPNDPSTQVLDDTLFSTDNSGTFRAIDTDDGTELFAFIPQQLLPNQGVYFNNEAAGARVYGLDGPLTVWRNESTDDDINVESADGDHVFAYVGMRRGGNNYYALDVTDRTNPILKWTIFGGSATGFKDMGQTWSRPILRKVNWNCDSNGENCSTRDVLFFAGGYDTVHDTATTPTSGDKGAAIYMVDADTGALLWSAGNNDDNSTGDDIHNLNLPMTNSIAGDVTAADMNGDGSVDILFAVDILGHTWRIDFNRETQTVSDFATGGEIANLTDTNEFRRFFVGPTVSLSQKRGREAFFVLTMGTGYVAHPLDNTADDRLYAIFERNVFAAPKDVDGNISYTAIDNSALLDLTSSANGPADPEGNAPHGFYKDATAVGEKFLRSAITQQGFTIYTSFIPEGNGVTVDNPSCGSAQLGGSRLFAMNFVTGVSAYTGEYIPLDHPGIAPEPVLLLITDEDTGTTEPILCVGTECFSPDDDENPLGEVTTQIMYWRENR